MPCCREVTRRADFGSVLKPSVDGVNVAARLEGIAQPGGISISEDAWRAEDISLLDYDVADVDADADFDALIGCQALIALHHPLLRLHGATDSVDDAAKFNQYSVAGKSPGGSNARGTRAFSPRASRSPLRHPGRRAVGRSPQSIHRR